MRWWPSCRLGDWTLEVTVCSVEWRGTAAEVTAMVLAVIPTGTR
jgi:hypothetical protein